jgi:hypothetical protein
MVKVDRIISWGAVATLASVVVIQQVQLRSTVVRVNEVDPITRKLLVAMAQAQEVRQKAIKEDLKRLPSDNFRSGVEPWGRE